MWGGFSSDWRRWEEAFPEVVNWEWGVPEVVNQGVFHSVMLHCLERGWGADLAAVQPVVR